MPGSCQAELLAELLAEDERDLLDHQSDEELKHSLFTVATSKLKKKHRDDFEARGFQLNDPESEGFLRYAEPTAIAKSDLSNRALCVDVYTSESLHVEPTPAKRKVKMIQQITAAWEQNKDGATPPHKRGVCSEANYKVFTDAGVALEDAQCCVFALSFYTGSGSNQASRGASLQVRKGNMMMNNEGEVSEYLDKYNHIIYFLSMALRNLPYYWGYCVRYITLNDDTAAIYEPGSVITWMQFSSTKKGSEAASSFRGRNCKFIIWSIKGRHIARFSNYAAEEDEVLFTPFTRLLVIKREHSDGHYVIHLREVELGLTTKGLPLLWVDDNILGKEFEMKAMMEEAMVKAGREIKYILKPSTHLALAFLESWFGLQVRKNGHFRVISDMGRPREPEGTHAGAILAREIWGLKLSVPIMIFTSNASAGLSKVGEKAPNVTARVLTSPEKGKPKANEVLITHSHKAAFAFCSFEGAASSVSSPAAWSWLDDGDRWKPYEGALAASIEAAFGDAKRVTVDLHAVSTGARVSGKHSSTYVINFDEMMQYNMSTKFGRPVRRDVPADPAVDGTWEWQDTDSSWKAYHPSACGQIALARRAGRQGTLLYAGRWNYWVDFSRSVQSNMSTHKERPIRHRA